MNKFIKIMNLMPINISTLILAIATVVLACVTVWSILSNKKENKKHHKIDFILKRIDGFYGPLIKHYVHG